MPEFISKVQHNNYEKGEFSEEKVRSRNETLDLVKNFPFDVERSLTEIKLTGPSVTIQDEDLNYLKVGLYFNGKLCIYYLDKDNHLYECYVLDIDAACELVKDFFNGTLDLSKFDKHLFNIGNQANFVTNYFEYRENIWRILFINSLLIAYGSIFIIGAIGSAVKISLLASSPLLFFGALFCLFIGRIFYNAVVSRHNYLQISKGNNVFYFGYNEDDIKGYNKLDIDHIVSYERNTGSRNPNFVSAYEMVFKDGSSLKFSNMLIPGTTLLSKFTDKMDNNYVVIVRGKKNFWQMMA